MPSQPPPVLTREALQIAREYVFYRLAEGWRLVEILMELDLPCPRDAGDEEAGIRAVAEFWLTTLGPASRAADAKRRVVLAQRAAQRHWLRSSWRLSRGRMMASVS